MDTLEWMRQVIGAATRVADDVYPYPGVAALLVWNGKQIALEHNGEPGKPHAEIKAIETALKGKWPLAECVLYTNLEPCSNVGLVLSCAEACIKEGIKEIHVAHRDPYMMVRGQGIERLRAAGVKVVLGEMEDEARWMNKRYFARMCPHCGWPVVG